MCFFLAVHLHALDQHAYAIPRPQHADDRPPLDDDEVDDQPEDPEDSDPEDELGGLVTQEVEL